jgi:hypothetical protein
MKEYTSRNFSNVIIDCLSDLTACKWFMLNVYYDIETIDTKIPNNQMKSKTRICIYSLTNGLFRNLCPSHYVHNKRASSMELTKKVRMQRNGVLKRLQILEGKRLKRERKEWKKAKMQPAKDMKKQRKPPGRDTKKQRTRQQEVN